MLIGGYMHDMYRDKFDVSVTEINNTATIHLNGKFSFDAHLDFKTAYKKLLNNLKIGTIVVNLSAVNYMDSSALGMLLVLLEHVQAANKTLILSEPNSLVMRTFEIASFHKIFTINS